jgi:hypothetical protein
LRIFHTLPKPILLSFYEVDILIYHNHLGKWVINLVLSIPKSCRKFLLEYSSNFIQKLIHNHFISNGFIEWDYQSKIKTWNYIFHGKIYGFIKENITIDHNALLIYLVVQYGSLCFFAIANEYAYDIFEIQFCSCFLSHMNNNTTKDTQMTCCSFVTTLNLFWCHGWNYLGMNLIIDICHSCHSF